MAESMRLHAESGLMVSGALGRSFNADRTTGQRLVRAVRYWWKAQSALHIEDEVGDGGGNRITLRVVLALVVPVLALLALLVSREPENWVAFSNS